MKLGILLVVGLLTNALLVGLSGSASGGAPPEGWGVSALLQAGTATFGEEPRVDADENGNVFAIWQQYNGTRIEVWANRMAPGVGWGEARVLSNSSFGGNNTTGNAVDPRVAADASGGAFFLWNHFNAAGSASAIFAAHFVGGWGWEPTVTLTTQANSLTEPDLAVSPGGNATAVWLQYDGASWNLVGRVWTPSGGWGPAAALDVGSPSASKPSVAMNEGGNATVVWVQSFGGAESAYARRFAAAGGWGAATLLENDAANACVQTAVAMDRAGNATVLWTQQGGGSLNLYASHFAPGAAWTARVLVESGAADVWFPSVGMDAFGAAVALWRQHDGTTEGMLANRFVPGTGWGTDAPVESYGLAAAQTPALDVAPSGEAVATTYFGDGVLVANRYTPSGGWRATEWRVPGAGNLSAFGSDAAVAGSGQFIVAWGGSPAGLQNIFANRYVEYDHAAPALTLAEPANNTSFAVPAVRVSGQAEPGAAVSVGGLALHPSPNGSFSVVVALAPGPNGIPVQATDLAGNVASRVVNVTFNDPYPALRADLEGLRNELIGTASRLSAVFGLLNLTRARLDLTDANISDLQGEAADLRARADDLEARLNRTAASLAGAESNISLLQQDLAALRTALESTSDDLARQGSALDARLNSTAAGLAQAQSDLAQALAELTTLDLQASAIETQTNANLSRISDQVGGLGLEIQALRGELDGARAALNLTQTDLAAEQNESVRLRTELNGAQAGTSALLALVGAGLMAVAAVAGVALYRSLRRSDAGST